MEFQILIPVLISLFFSALFSGSEIAFISVNKLHLELQGKKSNLAGQVLAKFANNPNQFISTTLLGNTIALVVYGIYMAEILEPVIWNILGQISVVIQNQGVLLIVQTAISTLLVLLTAEFIPKSLFMINPNTVLGIVALPMRFFYILLFPVVQVILGLSKLIITKVFGLDYEESNPVYGLTDLNNFIKRLMTDTENTDVEVDTKILDNALEFRSVRVRECMIPRTELEAVDIEETIQDLKSAFVDSGHTKILVYEESIDNIIGFCHSLELFKKPEKIRDILTPIIIVSETMLANELMVKFIAEHKSMALVVDEFGGTSGVVTLEDIIEEILGEIQDEHDEESLIEQRIDKHTFVLSARHEIDYLNDKYDWRLPTGDYETLGGLILSITLDLPRKNQSIRYQNFEILIESVENNRIDKVRLILK